MPHSDYELTVLAELEQSLKSQDPRLVEVMSGGNDISTWRRRAWSGVAAYVLGTIILVVCFTTSLWLGLVGVAVMTASAFVIEHNVRRLARAWGSPQDPEVD
jgi:lysophospholipase L1-like esterase